MHDETLYLYHAYCTLTGGTATAVVHRRNGRPAAWFPEGWDTPTAAVDDHDALMEVFMGNLTATERSTWSRILDGRSIPDIARDDGVSHAAIYARIRGRGQPWGGMVAKNEWVARWWARRCQHL